MLKKIRPPFASRVEAEAYIAGDEIECLLCGRLFRALSGKHLRLIHGVTPDQYRAQFAIPATFPLAGRATREKLSQKLREMHQVGSINASPLIASEAARAADRGKRVAWDIAEQSGRASGIVHEEIAAGGKRRDGRNADKAREYQRQYRRSAGRCIRPETTKEPPAEAGGS